MTSIIEPGLAFLEGLALIASPCILPVLPLVLSASIDGGKKRPFGIITGFVLAFSTFTLASREIVNALGVDPQIIQTGSIIFLSLFALILLSSKLSEKFSGLTQHAASLDGRFSGHDNAGGYFNGMIIGALIGLIWTPCAGPILAAVLVQVIRQQTDLQSLIIIVPFAIGAGIPMLLIALMGRKVMSKLNFFTMHSEAVRKCLAVIILLSVSYIVFGATAQSWFHNDAQLKETQGGSMGLQNGLQKPYPVPKFTDIQGWINSGPLEMAKLKGKVVLIDFWTYSCINCVRTLPYITAWDQKYRDKGLVIIGVSAPEFEFEKNVNNVKNAIKTHGIKYPVALDNNLSTWSNFNNQYWPAHYLIDQNGQVVYTHFGEGHYDITENNIRFLLGLSSIVDSKVENLTVSRNNQTPETYLGYARAERYQGHPKLTDDIENKYQFSDSITGDSWALQGGWMVAKDKIVATQNNATLRFNFNARKVFLVLGPSSSKSNKVSIRLNGQSVGLDAGQDVKQGILTVDQHTLYELIDQKTTKQGLLEIQAAEPGLEAYAFTFGN